MKKRIGKWKGFFIRSLQKKGSSHLEMVTAFTLFIVFTIFLLYFLKAPGESSLSREILMNLEESFIDNTSTELVSFLIKPNESDCVKLDLSNFSLSGNSAVFTLRGEEWVRTASDYILQDSGRRNSTFSGSILTIDAQNIDPSTNESLRVYISEEITDTVTSCTPSGNFSVGSIKREKAQSYIKFVEFETNYVSDYNGLKTNLGLPPNVDFSITAEGLFNAEGSLPTTVDIISDEVLLDVVLPDGSIIKKKVRFNIW